MTDDPHERRRRYFEDYADRVDRHRTSHFFYEQRALDFATSAMKVLSYLNGGGLLAIPTVVALFHARPEDVKIQLVLAALAFILGLILVVVAQASAFFVMARRGEAERNYQFEQMELLRGVHYPETFSPENQIAAAEAPKPYAVAAQDKMKRSDWWRLLSLIFTWSSLVFFIAGCLLGAWAVLTAS
jgi:hypothetical protein